MSHAVIRRLELQPERYVPFVLKFFVKIIGETLATSLTKL
jgi:hypothetical protein